MRFKYYINPCKLSKYNPLKIKATHKKSTRNKYLQIFYEGQGQSESFPHLWLNKTVKKQPCLVYVGLTLLVNQRCRKITKEYLGICFYALWFKRYVVLINQTMIEKKFVEIKKKGTVKFTYIGKKYEIKIL